MFICASIIARWQQNILRSWGAFTSFANSRSNPSYRATSRNSAPRGILWLDVVWSRRYSWLGCFSSRCWIPLRIRCNKWGKLGNAIWNYEINFSHALSIIKFNHNNDIELICRAHQLVMEGYKYHFPNKNLVTVWSAPNYCYRCGNIASVLALDDYLNREFKIFKNVPESRDDENRRNQIPYFLWIGWVAR